MTVYRYLPAPIVIAGILLSMASPAIASCPLDHFFLGQDDGKLIVDKRRLYQDGNPAQLYYPLSWSFFGWWSVGVPGFSDTSDPEYGLPPEMLLAGQQNVDYQIWFELLDLAPNFRLYMEQSGTWLDSVGDSYNLSNHVEHHVHMKYRTQNVPQSPPPDYPFWVTFRLVDDFGMYTPSEPFCVVFNLPAATVEITEPSYGGMLNSLSEAELRFTFHRSITVVGDDPPVIITDADTQTQDYYAGYFTYALEAGGMELVLTQAGGMLPPETELQIELTEALQDANSGHPVVPYTQYVITPNAATWCLGDLDCSGGAPDFADIMYFVAALNGESNWQQYYRARHAGADPPCPWLLGDFTEPPDGVEFSDILPFSNHVGQGCVPY